MKFELALEKARKLKLVEGNIVDNPDLDGQKLMQSNAPVYRFCKHRKLNLNEVNKRIWIGLKANAPEMDCLKNFTHPNTSTNPLQRSEYYHDYQYSTR